MVSEVLGVKSSYKVKKEITTLDLCLNSTKKILKKRRVKKEDIDILVFVTQTPDYLMPSCSNIIHHKLKLKTECITYDINLGCSGYVYGLWNIISIMKQNKFNKGLLLVGDTISKTIKKDDFANKILFGDAGSATLLCKQKNSKIYFHLGSEINGYDKLILNNSGFRDFKLNCPNFYMDGKEVFNFAIRNVPKISRSICKFSKIKINQLDYFVFHQANKMMLDKIFEELEIKEKKRLFSIEKFGNTSSASIPITLSFHKSKVANKNVNILISGFGAGFSYASAILNLKQTKIFHTNFYG
jgi:3-oxoacyl-[acyl-carrier-protein] synthase-3